MSTQAVAREVMKVAQISKPGGDFEVVEREIPNSGPGQVRIKIQACGVCHSDVFTKEGTWPGIEYPRVPGHEVVGIIDEVGSGVSGWTMGQRAAARINSSITGPVIMRNSPIGTRAQRLVGPPSLIVTSGVADDFPRLDAALKKPLSNARKFAT